MNTFSSSPSRTNSRKAGKSAGAIWEASTKSNVGISQLAAETAVKAHGAPYGEQALEWARIGTLDGFGDASVNVAQMADDLETEIQPG